MEIKIIGEHLTITEAISSYIKEKFSHLPSPEKLQYAEFRLGTRKENQYIHFKAHCPKDDFYLESTDTNMYVAIDKMMQKIHRKFISAKEKNKTRLSGVTF